MEMFNNTQKTNLCSPLFHPLNLFCSLTEMIYLQFILRLRLGWNCFVSEINHDELTNSIGIYLILGNKTYPTAPCF